MMILKFIVCVLYMCVSMPACTVHLFIYCMSLSVYGSVIVLVCVRVCIEVTGNLKCERLVSPQHDDFLCQQTVSWKIEPYYDEINFNGQGFQIFPTKSLKIKTFNDASFCSSAVFYCVEFS